MRQHQVTLRIETQARRASMISTAVAAVVQKSGVTTGLCNIYLRHTSASLLIMENADPMVLEDLEEWLAALAPDKRAWRHVTEGTDDMPAHAKAALLRTSETVPVADGKLQLGTWQGIFVLEHRATGHFREVIVHVLGN